MNELSSLFLNIRDGETITLEKDKIYHVCEDDSFYLEGYFCSNTAKFHENPKGIHKPAIYLKNKKNITINGNGATLLVHGKMTPLVFDECENIAINSLTIDYACPTMTEFEILSGNKGICQIKINPDCHYRIDGSNIFWQGEKDKNGVPYWEDTHNGKGRYFKIFNPETKMSMDFNRNDFTFKKVAELSENLLELHFVDEGVNFPAGSVVQTRSIVRDCTGSIFQRCKNLTLENLRIKFMHGLGMVSQFSENITYRNCDLTPKENRTITSTADFFQFSGCKGNILIENCAAWGAQDDHVNVHGTHLQIYEACREENSISVRFMHPESWGFQAFEKGDEIEFIKWDTLIPFGKATVLSFERIDEKAIKLFLAGEIPPIELCKDSVENATRTPSLHIKDCDFGASCGRGVLCTTRGKIIIENNKFTNLWGPALLIEDDCNFWFESGYTRDVVFRNNYISNCSYGNLSNDAAVIRFTPKVMKEDSREFVHKRLEVSNNIFDIPFTQEHLIWLEYLEEAHIKNNTFCHKNYRIEARCTGKIFDENNILK